jgi:hypothetical protein
MDRLSPDIVAHAIRTAPAFARLGLSMRDPRFRDRAADALAAAIVEEISKYRPESDEDQLALPFQR